MPNCHNLRMPFAILGGGSNIYILHAEWGFAKTPKRDYVIYGWLQKVITIIFNLMGKLLSEEEPRSVDHSDQLEESYDTCDF